MRTLEQSEHTAVPAAEEGPANVVHTTIRLGGLDVAVDEIGVVQARAEIPRLIRASAQTGRAFHIRNAKNPHSATALLVSPEALEKLVFKATPSRTLGEVLDALPFKHTGAGRGRVAVPDNAVRALRVPAVSESPEESQQAWG